MNDGIVGEPVTVAARLAARFEHTTDTVEGPFRSGARSYTYLIDLGRTVLAAQYYAPPGQSSGQYNSGKQTLDELVASFEFGTSDCLNSTDSRCGNFYWTAAPAENAALQITLPPQPVEAEVGQLVTFDVTAEDPDAAHLEVTAQFEQWACVGDAVAVGFGDLLTLVRLKPSLTSEPSGPWQPPPRTPGRSTSTVSHTFTEIGEHVARISIRSTNTASPPGHDPYGSYDECLEVKVAVR